ncbi:MAG: tyrosine-type recombinase/integrase [Kofleriaceae bacterium]
MPAIKVKAVPPPPIEPWTFEEYGRLLGAAWDVEPWSTAVLLAGECGLRIGEIIALEWSTLDLVANTITIVQQERQGVLGPPKGGKPRTVPMTARLAAHLRAVPRIRNGRVVAIAGAAVTEGEAKHALERICRAAGLPARLWHRLRHSYATHAAMLGVGPVRLKNWLGHSTLSMTLRYLAFAEDQSWPIADEILLAGADVLHPDKRVVAQLGARPLIESRQPSAKTSRRSCTSVESRLSLVGAAGIEPATYSV